MKNIYLFWTKVALLGGMEDIHIEVPKQKNPVKRVSDRDKTKNKHYEQTLFLSLIEVILKKLKSPPINNGGLNKKQKL